MPTKIGHVPTEQTKKIVLNMAAFSIPRDRIADVIGICEKTLYKHYREELNTSHTNALAQVASTLYQTATDRKHPSHVTAAIFYLKTQGGWKETMRHELSLTDDGEKRPDLIIEYIDAPDGGYTIEHE